LNGVSNNTYSDGNVIYGDYNTVSECNNSGQAYGTYFSGLNTVFGTDNDVQDYKSYVTGINNILDGNLPTPLVYSWNGSNVINGVDNNIRGYSNNVQGYKNDYGYMKWSNVVGRLNSGADALFMSNIFGSNNYGGKIVNVFGYGNIMSESTLGNTFGSWNEVYSTTAYNHVFGDLNYVSGAYNFVFGRSVSLKDDGVYKAHTADTIQPSANNYSGNQHFTKGYMLKHVSTPTSYDYMEKQSSDDLIKLPRNSSFVLECRLTVKGDGDNARAWKIQFGGRCNSAGAVAMGTVTSTLLYEEGTTGTPLFTTATDGLKIEARPATKNRLIWTADVELTISRYQ